MRYYYKELDRFRAHLIETLEGKSLVKLVRFGIESLFYSQLRLLGFAIQRDRAKVVKQYIKEQQGFKKAEIMLKLLVKYKALTSEELSRKAGIPERTCREYLKKALDLSIINKAASGKKVFYSLNAIESAFIDEYVRGVIKQSSGRIGHIPVELDLLFRDRLPSASLKSNGL